MSGCTMTRRQRHLLVPSMRTRTRSARTSCSPTPAKKPRKFKVDVESKLLKSTHEIEREEGFAVSEGKKEKTSAGFAVDVLKLPASKGPSDIIKIWQDRAKADALVAFLNVETK